MVLAGLTPSATEVIAGLDNLAEEAKTKPWLLTDSDGALVQEWIALCAFSDAPGRMLSAMDYLPEWQREPWQIRKLLSALSAGPSDDAEGVLVALAKSNIAFLGSYDWVSALANRGTTSAALALADLVIEFEESLDVQMDEYAISNFLAAAVRRQPELREMLRGRFAASGSDILASTLSEGAGPTDVEVMLGVYAERGRAFDQHLADAVEGTGPMVPMLAWA